MTDETQGHGADCGCPEYEALSRRQFITDSLAGAGTMGAAAFFPEWLPRVVMAKSEDTERDVIVSIFLRGGADGLTLCVPFGDANYTPTTRPTIFIPRPDDMSVPAAQRSLALDNFFAMPPAMGSLYPAYASGDLLYLHACGQLNNSRSHFDAQRYMEVGKAADPSLVTGWLGRHLASTANAEMRTGAPLRALGLSSGLPKTLVGGPKTLPIADPRTFSIGGSSDTRAQRLDITEADYGREVEPLLAASALNAVRTVDLLASIPISTYAGAGGVTYPNTSIGRSLRSVAALIAADVGVEAAAIDLGGWDTHASQGSTVGSMFNTMQTLAQAMAAFHADIMAARGIRATLVAMSEFGRNVRENGSQGTDHGRASAMMVMGRGIAGGRVLINSWPGLATDQLENRQDLRVTLDFRDVLAEIVANRLNNAGSVSTVFPGYTPVMRGVTR
jgi:uncharacterized protein (DUF1501 family)